MIFSTLLLLTQLVATLAEVQTTEVPSYVSHSRENPTSAIEYVDHYDYCLSTIFERTVTSHADKLGAAKSAIILCEPVRVTTTSVIYEHLKNEADASEAAERQKIICRVLDNVTGAFLARVEVRPAEIADLCLEQRWLGFCNAQN